MAYIADLRDGRRKCLSQLSTRHGNGGRPRTPGAAAGTRWDRVRLNRLIGSIPVAPTSALAGPWVTRHRGKPGDTFSFLSGLAQHPAVLSLPSPLPAIVSIMAVPGRFVSVWGVASEQACEYRRKPQPSGEWKPKSAGAEEGLDDLREGP
jgi:hypothetical protein